MCSETAVAASALLYFLREVAVTCALLKVLGDSTCSMCSGKAVAPSAPEKLF